MVNNKNKKYYVRDSMENFGSDHIFKETFYNMGNLASPLIIYTAFFDIVIRGVELSIIENIRGPVEISTLKKISKTSRIKVIV